MVLKVLLCHNLGWENPCFPKIWSLNVYMCVSCMCYMFVCDHVCTYQQHCTLFSVTYTCFHPIHSVCTCVFHVCDMCLCVIMCVRTSNIVQRLVLHIHASIQYTVCVYMCICIYTRTLCMFDYYVIVVFSSTRTIHVNTICIKFVIYHYDFLLHSYICACFNSSEYHESIALCCGMGYIFVVSSVLHSITASCIHAYFYYLRSN